MTRGICSIHLSCVRLMFSRDTQSLVVVKAMGEGQTPMEPEPIRGALGPRLDLRKWRAWIVLILVVVAAATATSVPWNWRFPLLYLVIAFVLRLTIRTKHHDLNVMAPLVVLSGTLHIAVRTFYGGPWLPGGAVAHAAALYTLSVLVAFVLAEWVRPVDPRSLPEPAGRR